MYKNQILKEWLISFKYLTDWTDWMVSTCRGIQLNIGPVLKVITQKIMISIPLLYYNLTDCIDNAKL